MITLKSFIILNLCSGILKTIHCTVLWLRDYQQLTDLRLTRPESKQMWNLWLVRQTSNKIGWVSHINSISCWLLCPISALFAQQTGSALPISVCSYTLLYYKCLTGFPGTHTAAGFVQYLILPTITTSPALSCLSVSHNVNKQHHIVW